MLKKIIVAGILIFSFAAMVKFLPQKKFVYVTQVISPVEIVLDSGVHYKLKEETTFDDYFSEKNKTLASNLNISEEEAFILGNLGKYYAANLLEGREVFQTQNDLIFSKYSYKVKFRNSPFCIINLYPANGNAFTKQLNFIRKHEFLIYEIENDKYVPISKNYSGSNFILVKQRKKKTQFQEFAGNKTNKIKKVAQIFETDNIKIIVSDFTQNLKPDRNCTDSICKEILTNINNAQTSIDIAIYGYSSTRAIEYAVKKAAERGVKIRLVYDEDKNGNNIYPDTKIFTQLVPNNKSDKNSSAAFATMHDKFYIFDNKIVITGSANLSHTDMSGFNTNNIIVIKSPEVAKYYKNEFEQMYNGVFHFDKISTPSKKYKDMEFYFSPQDKTITNAILPLIKNAKKYIYIPTFVITEKRIVEELINAKSRGVDVKIILDALSASNKSSKHKELRVSGIPLKTENWAGKMHSKTMIIDDEFLVLGSMNFSNSGENKNDENLVILKNHEATLFYKNFFLYQWNKIPDKWLKFSARAEGIESIGSCSDGIDNDYDGLIDLQDEGCKIQNR